MISVKEAENKIWSTVTDYGCEFVAVDAAIGRVLANHITADREMPPFNRVAMDGIAIRFEAIEQGIRTFQCKGTQAAGEEPINIDELGECVEIMTGSALPPTTDTVIRYEDLTINSGMATIETNGFEKLQHVHLQGMDGKRGAVLVAKGSIITPAIINVAASVGASTLCVKKLPRTVIISTGNEVVPVDQQPTAYQIRQSNNHMIRAALTSFGMTGDLLHIPDNLAQIKQSLERCLEEYNVLVLTGGVSAGKYDYLPQALEAAGVQKLFHKVAQKPGKPFWFGRARNGAVVFAFPGNPVSSFLCLHRYLIPWLKASLGLQIPTYKAALGDEVCFTPALQCFLLVKLQFNEAAQLIAKPVKGNGSGDLVSLAEADGFIELPAEADKFPKHACYRIWPFQPLL